MRSALRSLLLSIPSFAILGCGSDSATSPNSPFSADSGIFTDSRDGRPYRTVRIGSQRWMAQNLNYKVDSSFCYNNSTDSCANLGRLYPWQVAMALDTAYSHTLWNGIDTLHHQGVCPAGWRMPSTGDWSSLVQFAGRSRDDSAAIKLKAATDWPSKGIDAFGFDALPSGQRDANNAFQQRGAFFTIWTSVDNGASTARNAYLQNENKTTIGEYNSKKQAFAVRCILD